MTILLKEYNKTLANEFFDKKREMYEKSKLPLNKDITQYDEFSKKEIEERQNNMAEIANDLWKIG